MTTRTEADVERAAINWLAQLEWQIVPICAVLLVQIKRRVSEYQLNGIGRQIFH